MAGTPMFAPSKREIREAAGATLRCRRVAQNRVQRQMAAELETDQATISDIERGRVAIESPLVARMAALLGLSLSDLLHEVADRVKGQAADEVTPAA